MPHNSYIKDLNRFPPGDTRSLAGQTDTVNYKNTTEYVALTSNTVIDDGTGLNDLVKFRLKYENPSYVINVPTTISFLHNFILTKTVRHSISSASPPFSWQKFRGATAMNISYVTGKGESPPDKRRNSWGNPFKSRFWICQVFPGLGFKRDKKRCYTYTYKRDARFTMQVEGGYGDPSNLVVTLKKGNGVLVSTQRPNSSGQVTFTGLPGSANDNDNPGPYIIETGDISTGYVHNTRMFVPYEPLQSTFIHSRSSAGISQSFAAGGTFSPNFNNAIWANERASAAPPSADLIAAELDVDDTLSNCATNRINFFADIDEYFSGNINWKFSYKLDSATSWTSVGAFQTILGTSLTSPVQVSAFANIPVSQFGGDYKLELQSPTGNITFDKTSTGDPAKFELTPPDVDETWDKTSTTQTSTPIPLTTNKNYRVTFNYTASSCQAYKVELLRWNNDQSGSLTVNMPLSAPLAGFTIVTSATHPANTLVTSSLVDISLTNRAPGTQFTYALRFKNTIAPFTAAVYPEFVQTAASTDPDTGAAIPATFNFQVVTLT